ncbi:hypothetical protein ACWJJH_07615 [Endozoicomonadaceae bacterium StTr2]
MRKFCLVLIALVLTGCATTSTQPRPNSYYSPQATQEEGSDLFKTGQNLSEQDIERILNYRLSLPAVNRVAILKLSKDSYWRYYSNDFVELTDSISEKFIGKLLSSDRIYDASFLPSMLVPEKRTVAFLRESAARYQADLLLVYRSRCNDYQKYRFLAENQVKSYCSVEAALLDVRKGIIPFTSVSTNSYELQQSAADQNLNETRKKAELAAISRSLAEVADQVTRFLKQVPVTTRH